MLGDVGVPPVLMALGRVMSRVLPNGLPLLLAVPAGVWAVSQWYYTLYFQKLSCVLTARKLAPDIKISVTIRIDENEDIARQAGADTVINLAAILAESKRQTFELVHHGLAAPSAPAPHPQGD